MPKRVRCSLFVLLLCLSITGTARMQESAPPFYVATWNNNTRLSTIWYYEPGATQLLKFTTLSQQGTVKTLFSQREFDHYEQDLKDTGYIQTRPIWENTPIIPVINRIWRLDDTHLLLLTYNDARVQFAADNWESFVSGYHEFVILDVDTLQTRTLLKIDYHDETYYNQWGEYAYPFVNIQDAALNPVQDKFAVQLRDSHRFDSPITMKSILIVDYSDALIQTHVIPQASSDVFWSPDGRALAYFKAECVCEGSNVKEYRYTTSLKIDLFDEGRTLSLETLDPGAERFSNDYGEINMLWLDNENLLYQWYPTDMPLDESKVLRQYDLYSNTTLDLPKNHPLSAAWDISRSLSQPNIIIGESGDRNGKRRLYTFSPEFPFEKIFAFPVPVVTSYDIRFPQRSILTSLNLYTHVNHQPTIVFDDKRHETSIDLWKVLPADEWIVDIAA